MNRREFAKLGLMAGALGIGGIPLGITRAVGQTRGGTLNTIIQPEPPILVTALNQQQPTLTLGGKIYESLLRYDFDLKPLPGLAQSWEVSPDKLTYTFKLFPNITFHDGTPLTSEDVVFSVMKILIENHARARNTFSRIDKAEAPDPLTVVFTLKKPFAPFLTAFDCTTAPIVPKHIYDGTDYRKNPANAKAIGSGPFKLKEWVRGSHVHLVRHEGYYRPGEPFLDEIIYRVIPDSASRSVALEQGTVQLTQWTDVELFEVPRLSKLPNLTMTTKGYEFFAPHTWLEINNRIAPMNDKRFRQAVMYAIDRKALLNRIYFGLGKVATGPVSSKTKFYEKNVKSYDFSPEKAKALLDEMGLKPGPDGKRVTIPFMVSPYGETHQRTAEFLRQSLARVGIDLQLQGIDVGGWAEKFSNWDFSMTTTTVYQFGDPALGVSRSYVSSNIRKGILFSNTCGYSNPEVDRLFEEAATATSDDTRQELYSQVQKIMVEEVPVAWLLEIEYPNFMDKRLKNVVTSAIGVHDTFGTVSFG
ncbi:ABC transporter substrate-binding protein [Rhodopseudomonas sp. BR0C11]|uniref:ABC transporter substrate-binding protein n=1 Tax=Rhodopseudomonas sp. BR0C11 TaxID=2269370 RepID=UPI0013E0194D|nr:ABC transporter substrate-binding protein [Rhodopseudomonas sp. BR0C11]NEV78247.1 ABC transporter substrate-binding protein [Rhodopseudomonas sp. BR0C11]